MFKFDYNNVKIEVKDAAERLNEWTVKTSETTSYSKSEIIVQAFEKEFSNIKLLGDDFDAKYDYLTKVCSRSTALLEWFSLQKLNYSELSQLPAYLDGLVDKKEFKHIQVEITKINNIISDYAAKRNEATDNYKAELKRIDKDMETEINKIKSNSNVVKILTLNSQCLPLQMAFALESFNTKTSESDFEEKKKLYVRELLTNFKVSLLKAVRDNPDIDIDDLINELRLK